jgi:hypothetical protein
LEPIVVPTKSIIKAKIKKNQQNKWYYDKVSKPLPPLVVGENIRTKVKSSSSPCWSKGTVVRKQNDRSYVVETSGKQYRRNRFHIRKSGELVNRLQDLPDIPPDYEIQPERMAQPSDSDTPSHIVPAESPSESCAKSDKPQSEQSTTIRRSGRIRKPNLQFKDFVLYK